MLKEMTGDLDLLGLVKPPLELFMSLLPRLLMADESEIAEILMEAKFDEALAPFMALFNMDDNMDAIIGQIMAVAGKMAEIVPRLMAPNADFAKILMDADLDGIFGPLLQARVK